MGLVGANPIHQVVVGVLTGKYTVGLGLKEKLKCVPYVPRV